VRSDPEGSGGPLDEALVLEVPGDPSHLATARLFAATVGRHFGADEEMIEDLKLGVSEAVAATTAHGGREGRATISARMSDGSALSIEVRTSGKGLGEGAGATDVDRAMSLEVLRGLFDDTEVADEPDGWSRVRFSVPLAAGPAHEPSPGA
jgi:anti-sigma regulatory factor (Ser/Thr protein kinase)